MGDTKKGREKQADDEERRQRKRELSEALDRGDESEPIPADDEDLGDLDAALDDHEYPTTTDDVIADAGDRTVETRDGRRSVETVLAPIDDERYDSADDVRARILELIRRD